MIRYDQQRHALTVALFQVTQIDGAGFVLERHEGSRVERLQWTFPDEALAQPVADTLNNELRAALKRAAEIYCPFLA